MNVNTQIVDFLGLHGVAERALGGTAAAITDTYPTQKGASYSFEYQFSSGGTIDVKVELEQGNVPLTTQRVASADYVVPQDAAAFDTNAITGDVHIKAYAPAATSYLRLKFTGQGINASTTKLIRAKMAIILGS